MVTSDEVAQLNHEAWKALARGAQEGWDVAVGNVIRLVEPEDTPDRDAKIAFVTEFVGKVAARPDELVVFHRTNEEFTQFNAVVPDTKEPFEYCSASDRREKPFIYINNRTKNIGRLEYPKMAGSRDIAFSNTNPNPPTPVWMGPGSRPETISPDLFYDEKDAQSNVAVGSEEIAELFGSLRTETDTLYNSRLFGALFHVALLAEAFEVKIPQVSFLNEEAAMAQIAVENERSLSDTLVTIASHNSSHLKKLVDSYSAQTVIVRDLHTESREAEKKSAVPPLHRRRTNPLLAIEDIAAKMASAQDQIDYLVKDELDRKKALERQQRIIAAITGLNS